MRKILLYLCVIFSIILFINISNGALIAVADFNNGDNTLYTGRMPLEVPATGTVAVSGGPSQVNYPPGIVDTAFSFGNNTASDMLEEIFTIGTWNIDQGSQQLSICFWVYFDNIYSLADTPPEGDASIPYNFISKRGTPLVNSYTSDPTAAWGFEGLHLTPFYGEDVIVSLVFYMAFQDVNGSYSTAFVSIANKIFEKESSHICGTFDSSVMRLYINASEVNSATISDDLRFYEGTGTPIYVGSYPYTNNHTEIDGFLDEIRIYDNALSSNEIFELFSDPVSFKNVPPSISFGQSTYSIQIQDVGERLSVSPTIVDPIPTRAVVSTLWQETSNQGCRIAVIESNPASPDLTLAFSGIANGLTFGLFAFDGELFGFNEITVDVTGVAPILLGINEPDVVYLTEDYIITANFTGFPLPSFN